MKIKTSKMANKKINFYYYDLNNPIETDKFKNYHIGKANILDFFRSFFLKNPKLNYKQCLKRKDKYFIVRKQNKILSLGRICYKNTKEVDLEPFEASLVSFLTIKEYRNRGMYKSLIKEMMIYLKKKGFKRCIIWTFENNIPSRVAIEKMNFKRI